MKRLRHRELKQFAQSHQASGSRVHALNHYAYVPSKIPCDTTAKDVRKSVAFMIMMGITGTFFKEGIHYTLYVSSLTFFSKLYINFRGNGKMF